MAGPDLATDLCGLRLDPPILLASGVLGETGPSLLTALQGGAGGVVTKSIGPVPRDGHPNPTVVDLDGAFLNAMGLPNPGAEAYREELAWLREQDPRPVIVSVFGATPEEYATVATTLEPWADAFELNLSCPHAKGLGAEIGSDPGRLEEVVKAVVGATGKPVLAKLTPNTSDVPALARAAEGGGASGLVAINTLRAMVVDLELGRPALANVLGGLSGPAIRPVGVRCVHEACQAVSIPVVGVGGIASAEDALEYFMAGATAVEVGTAVSGSGPGVFAEIASGLERWLEEHGFTALDQVRGVVQGGDAP
jgi:dihydroorotate dehydrogenase (NAD+) catalytic subunit